MTTSYPVLNTLYYKNILDDLADKLDVELMFDELIEFIKPDQVPAFIEHLREVADIEQYIPTSYPTSEQQQELSNDY